MLSFGCYPMVVQDLKTVDEILNMVRKTITMDKLVKKGDKVVIVAGMPFGTAKEVNFILVETLSIW